MNNRMNFWFISDMHFEARKKEIWKEYMTEADRFKIVFVTDTDPKEADGMISS